MLNETTCFFTVIGETTLNIEIMLASVEPPVVPLCKGDAFYLFFGKEEINSCDNRILRFKNEHIYVELEKVSAAICETLETLKVIITPPLMKGRGRG